MMRRCKWCGKYYDTKRGSSVWCDENPHRGRGAEQAKKSMTGRGRVVIGPVVVLKSNPLVVV